MELDRGVATCVLGLLRQWGWETGIQKLNESIPASGSEADNRICQQFLGWLAAERGDYARAEAELTALTLIPELAGWSWIGLAFVAMRARDFEATLARLARAEEHGTGDTSLLGGVRLLQGTTRFHRGELEPVLPLLEEAAQLIGPECYSRGRVLDALGMWYASQDNVQAAIEFYRQSLQHKQQFHDDAGLAVTHGQFGRLHLDWGQFRLAEQHFREDLDICRRIDDRRGEAQMYGFLGVVAMANREIENAAAYLDCAIESSQAGGWSVLEGYARKDRALCCLADGDVPSAMQHTEEAQRLFERAEFAEGLAHVNRVRGMLLRSLEQWNESDTGLRRALQFFERVRERAEVAKTRLEMARTLKARGAPLPLVRDEFIVAVQCAERSRRPHLVQEADRELATVDSAAGARHIYQRVRGRRIDEDSTSLTSAEQDIATVFFFDLQGFTTWSRDTDPTIVMLSLNQMMAVFSESLTRHDVDVFKYLGDGILALARGPDHARRGVRSALAMNDALDQFNRPRRLLGLHEFKCRIGIATGEVVLGNVGTFEKLAYDVIGTTVNLAARIQPEAIPGCPCVNQATWDAVQCEFQCHPESPRRVNLKGLGERLVWDIEPAGSSSGAD